jgi:hypothetical protein
MARWLSGRIPRSRPASGAAFIAIHVYTGDFFGAVRSEWDPETLLERSYDVEKNLRLFEEANAAYPGT